MKKYFLFIALMFISLSAAQANSTTTNNINTAEVEGHDVIEILVQVNQAVDDLCNYFDDSWLDTGLNIYCKLGGDIYTCTAYRIVKYTCGINGVIKLSIEGDFEGALKRALVTATDTFVLVKNARGYELRQTTPNMTPRSDWY